MRYVFVRNGGIIDVCNHLGATRSKQLDLLTGLIDQEWAHESIHPVYRTYSIPMLANHLICHEN